MATNLAPTTGRSVGLANIKATQASTPTAVDVRSSALAVANTNFQLTNLTNNASGVLSSAANDVYPANVVAFTPKGGSQAPHSSADFTNPDLDLSLVDYSQNRNEEGYDIWLAKYFGQKATYVDDWEDPKAANDDMLLGDVAAFSDDKKLKRHYRRPRLRFRSRKEEEREREEEEERRKRAEKEEKPGENDEGHRPRSEAHGKAERGPTDKGLPGKLHGDIDAPALVRDSRPLMGAEDTARGLGDIGKLTGNIAEAGTAARTAWEGSRLLRIGGLLAGGLVVGTVGGILGVGVAVALVTGLVVYGVTRNKDKTIKAMLHMGREAIMPDEAIAAFKQGKILHGLDLTLGISSLIHLAKYVAKGGLHLAKAFIANPHAAMHEVAEGVRKTEHGIGTAVDLGVTLFSNQKTSGAAAQALSDAAVGENTGGTRNLATAVQDNTELKAKVAKLMGSQFSIAPPARGGRRPAAANDDVGVAYNNDNGPLHPSFTPDSTPLHELHA